MDSVDYTKRRRIMKARSLPLVAAALFCVIGASADVLVTIDGGAMTNGYMNVFNLPAPDGDGAYQFSSPWGIADLSATFSGGGITVTMIPNSITDPSDYWYIGGGAPGNPGNKIMEASLYNEVTGAYAGQTVTFSGNILENSLTPAHEAVAFIRDFAPDYSSFTESAIPLSSTGLFSIDLATGNDAGRHVQYGIQMTGVNVWATDLEPFGSIVAEAIPEPSSIILLMVAGGGLWGIRRRLVM